MTEPVVREVDVSLPSGLAWWDPERSAISEPWPGYGSRRGEDVPGMTGISGAPAAFSRTGRWDGWPSGSEKGRLLACFAGWHDQRSRLVRVTGTGSMPFGEQGCQAVNVLGRKYGALGPSGWPYN